MHNVCNSLTPRHKITPDRFTCHLYQSFNQSVNQSIWTCAVISKTLKISADA